LILSENLLLTLQVGARYRHLQPRTSSLLRRNTQRLGRAKLPGGEPALQVVGARYRHHQLKNLVDLARNAQRLARAPMRPSR
jgi:hypothetical protein